MANDSPAVERSLSEIILPLENAGEKPRSEKSALAPRTPDPSAGALFLQLSIGVILAAPILGRQFLGLSPYTDIVLSFLLVLGAGWGFHKSAARNLIWKETGAGALISFASWSAFLLGTAPVLFPRLIPSVARDFGTDILCGLILISIFGLWLAAAMDAGSSGSLSRLIRLPPKTGRILDADGERMAPVEKILPGAIAHARPGEQIPADGVVASGSSLVDESILSDAPAPALKSEGSQVTAGTVNVSDSLWLRVQKPGDESALGQIAAQALAKAAPGRRLFGFADNAAAFSLPLALIGALTLAVIWAIDGPKPRPIWACLVLFSIFAAACPCALTLGEPLAAWFGRRRGRGLGIFYRRIGALARMNTIDVILVGKSGVLTHGKPAVIKTVTLKPKDEKKALDAALAAAQGSGHAAAQAIAAYARTAGAKPLPVEWIQTEEGRGITARINGKTARLGGLSWLKSNGVAIAPALDIGETASAAGFAWDESAILVFILRDEPRADAEKAVLRMKKMGIETVLACGDRNESAYHAAEKAGIGRVFAEVLPDEKLRLIERLHSEGKRVAFLGRKFSDALSLCRADVSISCEPCSSVCRDIADIVIENGDISRLARAFEIAGAIRKTARKNVLWVLGINAALLLAAAGVLYPHFGTLIPPALAGAVILAQILAVGLNSSRLMKEKTP